MWSRRFVCLSLLVQFLLFSSTCGTVFRLHKSGPSFERLRLVARSLDERNSSSHPRAVFPVDNGFGRQGEYFLNIELGTPKKTFKVQIDTASSDLLVPGIGCSSCRVRVENRYAAMASSSGEALKCNRHHCTQCASNGDCSFSTTFYDGTAVSGWVHRDVLRVGRYSADVDIGIIEHANVPNAPNAPNTVSRPMEGIWGLAYGSISQISPNAAAYEQLVTHEQQTIPQFEDIFSLCFSHYGGTMAIGHRHIIEYATLPNNPKKFGNHPHQIKWTDLVTKSGRNHYYTVEMLDFKVDGVSIQMPSEVYNKGPGCILDSGTSLLYLPSYVYSTMMVAIHRKYCHNFVNPFCGAQSLFHGYCINFDPDTVNLPSFTLRFRGDIEEELDWRQYLYFVTHLNGYCLGISPIDNERGVVLGDIFFLSRHVIFDRKNFRIGFAKNNTCPPYY